MWVLARHKLAEQVSSVDFSKVEFERSFGVASQLIRSSCGEIVFAGRSNVGKSSLINKICNRKKLARVSSIPGKTITVNFYIAGNFRFVDLPGYGYAKAAKSEQARWSDLINSYFAGNRDIRQLFLLIDLRHKPSDEDMLMVEMLKNLEIPFVFVLTKADKIAKTKVDEQARFVVSFFKNREDIPRIPFSAVVGQGVREIRDIIEQEELRL
jgi:GTP-binding protein